MAFAKIDNDTVKSINTDEKIYSLSALKAQLSNKRKMNDDIEALIRWKESLPIDKRNYVTIPPIVDTYELEGLITQIEGIINGD